MTVEPDTSEPGSQLGIDHHEPLTERELEILRLVCQGMSNQEIADRLALSVGTVKTHVHSIFGKLGARDRPQAIATAARLGLGRAPGEDKGKS